MDEKTVIAGPPGGQKAAPTAPVTPPDDSHATVIAPFKPAVPPSPGKPAQKAQLASTPKAPPAERAGGKAGLGVAGSKAVRRSNVPVAALLGLMLVLIGLGSTLTTMYLLSTRGTQQAGVSDADLENDIVAIQSSDSEAEDEALIKDAITPRIIALSGDPVVIRQLSSSPRQLVKLVSAAQQRAMDSLGIRSDLFRLKDVLDVPNPGLQPGVFGSQEDIAVAQSSEGPDASGSGAPGSETLAEEGSSIIQTAGAATAERIAEFAQEVKAKAAISEQLKGLGFAAAQASSAEEAFASFYGRRTLERGDRLAVRAASIEEQPDLLQPVQISVYSADELVGSIALNDIDAFAKSEDPWYQRDIFETQLLPDTVRPEDRPRLLDAIYAAALRDRVPAAVVGETMMLLSRALDLEQKVQPGDSLTLIYSPIARDLKTGLGRIVFVSIGRTTGNLDCYVLQSAASAAFECVSAAGQNSVVAGGMVVPVNGIVVAKFGPQGSSADAAQEPMNFGVDWTAPLGSPVVAAFAGNVTAVGPEAQFGTVIRMSHADDKTTMYAYLQRVETGIVVGTAVKAGQVIGYVGTPASSREPRLHFELRHGGVPVDPVSEVQSTIGAGGAIDQFVRRIINIESANRCNARNPLSTAVGLGQFIESTWMTTIRLHRPDLLAGRSRRDVLDMRTNCNLARAMTAAFTNDNAAVIRKAGHGVTPGNLYLAHFLGVGGAIKVLSSQQNRLIAEVFGQSHVRANPFEQGKTTGYLVSWAAKKMASHAPVPAVSAPTVEKGNPATSPGTEAKSPTKDATSSSANTSAAPLEKSAGDPALAKLKDAVLAFLQ